MENDWYNLNQEAMSLYQKRQYSSAITAEQKALEIARQTDPDHPRVAVSLNNLAALYQTLGQYKEAEPLHKRSLEIYEKAYGPDHPHVATSLNNLAALYYTMGQYAEAEPLHKRSLEIYEKAYGPDHPNVAVSLNNLAGVYRKMAREEEARPLEQRAAHINANKRQ